MIEKLRAFVKKEHLFEEQQTVLIAVSGGIDSVVLCFLMKKAGYSFGMAHCNFKLRGDASDGDAVFVKELAEKLNVPYFEKTFYTEKIAKKEKKSIQIIARELRYDWLENIRIQHQYSRIATAHHLNDSIETVLYNITKGCGIRGLHGILPLNGSIIRPLLFATKEEIKNWATQNEIFHRKDASNATDKYSRNRVRHHVTPILKTINPAFERTFEANIKRFRELEKLQNWAVEYWREELMTRVGEEMILDATRFDELPTQATILYEILLPYGFNAAQIEKMLALPSMASGQLFSSNTFDLLVNRGQWIIRKQVVEVAEMVIEGFSEPFFINENTQLYFQQHTKTKDFIFKKNKNIAYFDAEKIKLPLRLRRWKEGDVFEPFGMNGRHKKVSDVFKNAKLSLFEKEKIWILESENTIVWVVGMRTDERFRVTEQTDKILEILL
ncbi:MAG: tRNA lysidine(34) synthetase TilS [Saprospiraceae bacterium]